MFIHWPPRKIVEHTGGADHAVVRGRKDVVVVVPAAVFAVGMPYGSKNATMVFEVTQSSTQKTQMKN